MEESVYSKEPVVQIQDHVQMKNVYIGEPSLNGPRNMGGAPIAEVEYTVTDGNGTEFNFTIPLSKCLLDPRKRYAIRFSVYEAS